MKKYSSFRSFYLYYLTEHKQVINRYLHFIGTAGLIVILILAIFLQRWWMLILVPVCGYGFAWAGHFFIERNKPATFTYPLYSLGSDFVMFWHMLSGQISKKMEAAHKTIVEDEH